MWKVEYEFGVGQIAVRIVEATGFNWEGGIVTFFNDGTKVAAFAQVASVRELRDAKESA